MPAASTSLLACPQVPWAPSPCLVAEDRRLNAGNTPPQKSNSGTAIQHQSSCCHPGQGHVSSQTDGPGLAAFQQRLVASSAETPLWFLHYLTCAAVQSGTGARQGTGAKARGLYNGWRRSRGRWRGAACTSTQAMLAAFHSDRQPPRSLECGGQNQLNKDWWSRVARVKQEGTIERCWTSNGPRMHYSGPTKPA